ncbi:MAG: phosphatase PAP2 family protein [Candidatus Paceibacterota bacterium]|jgi:undecaprenyl-diphosphatase
MNVSLFYFFYNLGQRFNIDWLISFFSSYILYILVVLFIFLIFKEKDLRKRIYIINITILSEILSRGIITQVIRFFYNRPRPFETLSIDSLISHPAGGAFPSGHTVFLFALVFVVFLLNKKWGWTFGVLSLVSVIGRVMAGVHWPVDILGGIIVAFVGFYIVYKFVLPDKKYLQVEEEIKINS